MVARSKAKLPDQIHYACFIVSPWQYNCSPIDECKYINNIHTLSTNIGFICTSFRNREKREHLDYFAWTYICKFYIYQQCTNIVFILQY